MRSLHVKARLNPIIVAGLVTLVGVPFTARGYERYRDGCQNCHGNFTQSGYVSASTGVPWPSNLHQVHRSSSYMNTDCALCHRAGDNDNPYLDQSDGTGFTPGYGCVGCHGSPTATGVPSGDSLQRHHILAGVTGCVTCHTPGNPVQESNPPPYYGSPDTNVAAACNDDAGTTEDWSSDGVGLDNDGDLLWDLDDPACQVGFLFHDGFVTGDGSGWVQTVPAH